MMLPALAEIGVLSKSVSPGASRTPQSGSLRECAQELALVLAVAARQRK